MLHRGFLLLCLLLTSLITTATVHAQESLIVPAFECSGTLHSDGDADQVPGDSDKAIPHHHSGCHGFAACVQPAADGSGIGLPLAILRFIPEALAPPRWSAGPQLRPPIA